MELAQVVDPMQFMALCWPDVYFYTQQREIMYSIKDNDETIVPAGNMLGKDFVSAAIVLWFFMTRHPCRIVTTSAKDDHLRVLWGEIGNFIQSSKCPMSVDQGGPLIVNHQNLRKMYKGEECKISYVTGMVAAPNSIAAMQGHHVAKTGDGIPRTLFVSDESSSVPDDYYTMARTWANRTLVIGNTWPCNNFFYHAVKGKPGTDDKGGDIPRPDNRPGFYRKVIKIQAKDSPNVRYALAEKAAGRIPSGRMLVRGVKDWEEYQKNLTMWDEIQICVSLNAEFYEGAQIRMYPGDWLQRAFLIYKGLGYRPKGKSIGCDPAEGGDKTSWTVIDEKGILEQIAKKTPDTSVIPDETLELAKKWDVPAQMVIFDRGGGGKQHADALRKRGFKCRTVAFGESVIPDKKRGMTTLGKRIEEDEQRYTYVNRRAEMYGMIRLLLDPSTGSEFGIPESLKDLVQQMRPVPLLYDGEGRIFLPPKNKKDPESKIQTLVELIGHSPDELDSFALAVWGMQHKSTQAVAGGIM